MTPALMELICCPGCRSPLDLCSAEEQDGEIWQGTLRCQRCQAAYPLQKGMPLLYVDDEKWAPKAREAAGWVTHLKNLNLYEPERADVDFLIPDYQDEIWIRIKKSLDAAMALLKLNGGETILDLGAGKGWAAKQFALKGCNVVALDITADDRVGLGRAKAIMREADIFFERIIADGENLPFHANSFDVVFCCGSIHHSSDLPLLMKNIGHILKPNGRLCAINEPCIDILADEEQVLSAGPAEEIALGINENRPNLIKYAAALWQNDFEILTAFPAQSIGLNPEQISRWAYELAATWRGLPFKGVKNLLLQSLAFAKREGQAFMSNGFSHLKIRLKSPKAQTARRLWAVLLWCHTELIFLARKTEA